LAIHNNVTVDQDQLLHNQLALHANVAFQHSNQSHFLFTYISSLLGNGGGLMVSTLAIHSVYPSYPLSGSLFCDHCKNGTKETFLHYPTLKQSVCE